MVIDSKNILTKYSNIYRKMKYLAMVKLNVEKPFFRLIFLVWINV